MKIQRQEKKGEPVGSRARAGAGGAGGLPGGCQGEGRGHGVRAGVVQPLLCLVCPGTWQGQPGGNMNDSIFAPKLLSSCATHDIETEPIRR